MRAQRKSSFETRRDGDSNSLSEEYEYVELRKDVYEKLEYAIKEMDLPFVGVSDFIDEQMKSALEKYAEWKEQTEENKKQASARISFTFLF